MKIVKNKLYFLIFLLLIIFVGGKFVFGKLNKIDTKNQSAQVINILPEEKPSQKTTLYFVGDIMLTRGLKSSVDKNFDGYYGRLFENLSELKNADILFGNLEGDVSDVGNNVGSKYSFRMDPKIMIVLKNAGFDILSFANNHVGDWNMAAFKDTLERLDENKILKIGSGLTKEEIENPQIIEKNGTHFGFLGFSDVGPNWLEAKADNPGLLLANDPRLSEIIKKAKMKCDVLIVSFHFGTEYATTHNSRQEDLAHTAIDSGADMIIGHHPHVIEDVEIYKGKPIVYSLGNFIFDQYFSRETMRGMLFSATFNGSELINTEEKIITLNKKFQPEGIFTKSEIREKDEINFGNCPKPSKEYFDMSLLNIGQIIKLPDTEYMPKNLRELNTEASTKKGICLIKEVRNAFEEMSMEAKKDGYLIKASSGFRSYDHQQNIFSNGLRSDKMNAIISIAKPGYSEHQLGTTVDITSSSINYNSASEIFENTPEDNWLKEHAYLYGFNQSYQKGKEDLTGYKYEPWHYRYVGIENAKKLKDGYTIPN